MNKEDFVTYGQAVKLKELGFDWECTHYYECGELTSQYEDVSGDGGYADYTISIEDLTYSANKNCPNTNVFDAPRLDQAQKWLREVKEIDVLVFYYAYGYGWEISKAVKDRTRGTRLKRYDYKGEHEDSGMWLSYEEALSAGISEGINLLTNKK